MNIQYLRGAVNPMRYFASALRAMPPGEMTSGSGGA
jgi:hypothetical protein